jgi:peroxin-6
MPSSTSRPQSSLQIAPSSLALQSFLQTLHTIAPNKTQRRDTPIEIRILDVVPVGLDTVYINLDTEALRKLDQVHTRFGGGFGTQSNGIAKTGPQNKRLKANGTSGQHEKEVQERVWRQAVRDALQAPTVLHTGDVLPLALPTHPITHVPPPPAKITACEPLSQGLLLPTTNIVILQSQRSSNAAHALPSRKPRPIPNGFVEEEDEDTSNEQFYSAAEDRTGSHNVTPPDEESTDNLDSELSGTDAGDLSDDSDDMISLSAPMLPPQSSGVLSSFSSSTPRPGDFRTNGIATPGSVFSSFTATTARGTSSKSRVFKAQGLLQSIPDELVYPKPGSDDDEEARVFVDTSTLVKVGCFSGDWVKLEASAEPSQHPLWGLGALGDGVDHQSEWRPAKIFGLPESEVEHVGFLAKYPSVASVLIASSASKPREPITSLYRNTDTQPVFDSSKDRHPKTQDNGFLFATLCENSHVVEAVHTTFVGSVATT